MLKWLEDEGHSTIMVGDSNGDRDTNGKVRYKKGRKNLAGEALCEAETFANHSWMKPNNKGECFTRFDNGRETMDRQDNFDQNDATSAVDHLSAGTNARRNGTVEDYSLNMDMHLGADHAGLSFSVQVKGNTETPLRKARKKAKRNRLGEDQEQADRFTTASEAPLRKWLRRARAGRLMSKKRRESHMNRYCDELTTILIEVADRVQGKTLPRLLDTIKSRKKPKLAPTPVKRASRTAADHPLTGWQQLLISRADDMKATVEAEKKQWAYETKNVETDLEIGQWASLWALKKKKLDVKQDATPDSFTGVDGGHIWEHKKVMEHARNEAYAIAEPKEDGYLSKKEPGMEED
jgi:hypothetical protein